MSTSLAEWFFYEAGQSPLTMMVATDVFAGVLAALLIGAVLCNVVDRNDAVRSRLATIGEMNHHVRNALQLISLSAYHTRDQEAITTISEGAERIEWALREILISGDLDIPPRRKPPHKMSS